MVVIERHVTFYTLSLVDQVPPPLGHRGGQMLLELLQGWAP